MLPGGYGYPAESHSMSHFVFAFTMFTMALSSITRIRTARRQAQATPHSQVTPHNEDVYGAWGFCLVGVGSLILGFPGFVSHPATGVVTFFVFIAGITLATLGIYHSILNAVNNTKTSKSKRRDEMSSLADKNGNVWPPPPRSPDDDLER